jgi:hypothetical protein
MNTKSIDSFWSLTKISALFGVKTGLVLSILYVVFFLISFFVVGIFTESFRGNPILTFGVFTILLAVIGGILGVIPSIIVGTITALTISTTLWLLKRWLSALLSVIVGMAICYGFATLVDYAIWSRITDRATTIGMAYYSWRGLPTIIYILTGGFMSWKLYKILMGKNSNIEAQADEPDNKIEV